MIDKTTLFNISYGLYVISCRSDGKDSGCIINTTVQVAESPLLISVAINKQNCTTEIIQKTGLANISVLTQNTSFSVFENFGFKSGRNTNKFENIEFDRTENGIAYPIKNVNSVISLKVVSSQDVGTHIVFLCEVTETKKISEEETLTYSYYHKNIKPKPQAKTTGWRCRICGYIHECETLPEDFICPLCKHGAEAFEKI